MSFGRALVGEDRHRHSCMAVGRRTAGTKALTVRTSLAEEGGTNPALTSNSGPKRAGQGDGKGAHMGIEGSPPAAGRCTWLIDSADYVSTCRDRRVE